MKPQVNNSYDRYKVETRVFAIILMIAFRIFLMINSLKKVFFAFYTRVPRPLKKLIKTDAEAEIDFFPVHHH